jgi:pimeloyl-ACP methyl ester carboxylesterase
MKQIYTAPAKLKNELFLEIAEIMRKADSFQSDGTAFANIDFEYGIYESVWGEAEKLRSSGELLRHAGKLKCPVTVIHGDYDPHPYLGVKLPLEKTTKDFRFLLLEKCGHEPWSEISAKDSFYSILENEI